CADVCDEGACDNPTSTSTSGTGGGGAGGSGSGANPACIPNGNDTPVADDCGVFASSSRGDDANVGSKDKPFKTLSKAIASAPGKNVYACAEPFGEAVTLDAKTTLYGGLDCAKEWAYVGGTKKTT